MKIKNVIFERQEPLRTIVRVYTDNGEFRLFAPRANGDLTIDALSRMIETEIAHRARRGAHVRELETEAMLSGRPPQPSERATALLLDHLTYEQAADYRNTGGFTVVGKYPKNGVPHDRHNCMRCRSWYACTRNVVWPTHPARVRIYTNGPSQSYRCDVVELARDSNLVIATHCIYVDFRHTGMNTHLPLADQALALKVAIEDEKTSEDLFWGVTVRSTYRPVVTLARLGLQEAPMA